MTFQILTSYVTLKKLELYLEMSRQTATVELTRISLREAVGVRINVKRSDFECRAGCKM